VGEEVRQVAEAIARREVAKQAEREEGLRQVGGEGDGGARARLTANSVLVFCCMALSCKTLLINTPHSIWQWKTLQSAEDVIVGSCPVSIAE
jgi:hypothetical protein